MGITSIRTYNNFLCWFFLFKNNKMLWMKFVVVLMVKSVLYRRNMYRVKINIFKSGDFDFLLRHAIYMEFDFYIWMNLINGDVSIWILCIAKYPRETVTNFLVCFISKERKKQHWSATQITFEQQNYILIHCAQ